MAGGSGDVRARSHHERFEEVYHAYSGLILAYVARRAATAEDAADIVAETFTTVWRRIEDLPAGDNARRWLYGVARRVLLNHHRAGRRQTRLNERLTANLPRLVEGSTSEVVSGPDMEAIASAFSRLRDDDQELLRLVGWDGLQRDEIAKVLGYGRATVRVRLHRARRRFERALEEAGVQRSETSGHGTSRWAHARSGTEEAL